MKLSASDHQRIGEAIAAAETKTSGEIFCVLAKRSSDYRETPVAWAAAAAFLLPLGLIPLGFGPHWLPSFAGGWTVEHAAATNVNVGAALTAYAVIQALVFILATLVVSLPPVRRFLTPTALKHERARQRALEQFLAKGLHLTAGRTGVLIFASAAERHVEVVADEGIHSKVEQKVWNDAVAALTRHLRDGRAADGFVSAIEICGGVLAQHFPPSGENPNELPDELVEI